VPAVPRRPFALLVALAGAAALAVVVLAAAGPVVWIAIAAAAACACGLVVGSTARVLPAMVLAVIAAAALVLAVQAANDDADPARSFQSVKAPARE
jgi:hypothetical protein